MSIYLLELLNNNKGDTVTLGLKENLQEVLIKIWGII